MIHMDFSQKVHVQESVLHLWKDQFLLLITQVPFLRQLW